MATVVFATQFAHKASVPAPGNFTACSVLLTARAFIFDSEHMALSFIFDLFKKKKKKEWLICIISPTNDFTSSLMRSSAFQKASLWWGWGIHSGAESGLYHYSAWVQILPLAPTHSVTFDKLPSWLQLPHLPCSCCLHPTFWKKELKVSRPGSNKEKHSRERPLEVLCSSGSEQPQPLCPRPAPATPHQVKSWCPFSFWLADDLWSLPRMRDPRAWPPCSRCSCLITAFRTVPGVRHGHNVCMNKISHGCPRPAFLLSGCSTEKEAGSAAYRRGSVDWARRVSVFVQGAWPSLLCSALTGLIMEEEGVVFEEEGEMENGDSVRDLSCGGSSVSGSIRSKSSFCPWFSSSSVCGNVSWGRRTVQFYLWIQGRFC